jgi:putative alpha-1,2-mannosidase
VSSIKKIAENNYMPFSKFSHDKEQASPGYYTVDLLDYGIEAELTLLELEFINIHSQKIRCPKSLLT